MANPKFEIEPDTGHETDSLVKLEESWTRMDRLLLVFGVVVNLGDGVEIYLPGSLSNTIISRSLAGYVEFKIKKLCYSLKSLDSQGIPKVYSVAIILVLRQYDHPKMITKMRKAPFYPGVITQQVSCEIELSAWKGATLDCIQYFTLAVAVVISGILADR